MSIELQIASSTIQTLVGRTVQEQLSTSCFPPVAGLYIDHANVGGPGQFVAVNGAVRLRLPVDVFTVRRTDVLAAPNAVPNGATTKDRTVTVVLEMAVAGTAVSMTCVDVEDAGPTKPMILQAVGVPVSANLAAAFAQIGIPTPGSARIELVGKTVTIRFDPSGNAAERLFPGQEWGLFIDGSSMEDVAKSRIPADLTSRVTSLALDAHWRPAGTTPHVDVNYAGKPILPDPFAATVDGVIGVDFAVTSTVQKFLRSTVHWSLNVHVDVGGIGLLEDPIEDLAEQVIGSLMNPAAFGGTPIGDHAFTLDQVLTEMPLGSGRCRYLSAVASAEGMTIGGPVRLPADVGTETLQPTVHPFGLPFRLTFCRELARSGSGDPSKTVSLADVTTTGSVSLAHLGALCDIELLSTPDVLPFRKNPDDSSQIRFVIPSANALAITEPVRLLVRTSRGVRLFDLGTPPPVILNAAGEVTNAQTSHIPNCLFIRTGHAIEWGRGVSDLRPPMEEPDWVTFIHRHHGIDVQLVGLSELQPGELIQFRSRDHAVNVTADRSGRALVPVLLPLANDLEPASLIRVNRSAIAGHFTVSSALFISHARVPAAAQQRVTPVGDSAVLTAQSPDRLDVQELASLGVAARLDAMRTPGADSFAALAGVDRVSASIGAPTLLERNAVSAVGTRTISFADEVALNPQPLPPEGGPRAARPVALPNALGLRGVESVFTVPGFADAPIALARMDDGAVLVLDRGVDGTPRVAGSFAGPIGSLDVAGGWAIAAAREQAFVFRVKRS